MESLLIILIGLLVIMNFFGAIVLMAVMMDKFVFWPKQFYIYHLFYILILPAVIFAYAMIFLFFLPGLYILNLEFWHRPLFSKKKDK